MDAFLYVSRHTGIVNALLGGLAGFLNGCPDQGSCSPAIYLSGFPSAYWEYVTKDYHGLCAKDQGKRFAEQVVGRIIETIPGGFESRLDQGAAAILPNRYICVVGGMLIQGAGQHKPQLRFIVISHTV